MTNLTENQAKSLALYEERLRGLKWSFEDAERHFALITKVHAEEPSHPLLPHMVKIARQVWLSHPDNPGWE